MFSLPATVLAFMQIVVGRQKQIERPAADHGLHSNGDTASGAVDRALCPAGAQPLDAAAAVDDTDGVRAERLRPFASLSGAAQGARRGGAAADRADRLPGENIILQSLALISRQIELTSTLRSTAHLRPSLNADPSNPSGRSYEVSVKATSGSR